MSETLPRVVLWSLSFAAVRETDAAEHVVRQAGAGRGGWLVTPNLDILRQSSRSPEIRAMLQRADVLVADGMPLIWASRLQKRPLPERVAGSNLVKIIAARAAERGLRIFLLGGDPGAADGAAAELTRRHPRLQVAGTYCPALGFERDPEQLRAIADAVRQSAPDIVFVGLGFPKQERLIEHLRPVCPNAWWLGIGISFSFLSGDVRRAPAWMQRSGLEWVHRLWQEPRRLVRRYLVDGIPFAALLFAGALRMRLAQGWRASPGEK